MSKQTIGFTGSRHGFANVGLVKATVTSCLAAGHSIAVGCANGVDSIVRQTAPQAKVYKVASAGCGTGRSVAAALAQRSQFMVQAASVLVGFCSTSCPNTLTPANHFTGQGSGTWSSIAYAVAKGLQVFIFLAPGAQAPIWGGGQWVQACPSGFWSKAFTWQAHSNQLKLF